MKKIIVPILSVSLLLVACNNNNETPEQNNSKVDSVVDTKLNDLNEPETKLLVEDEKGDFKLTLQSEKSSYKKGETVNILAKLETKKIDETRIGYHGMEPLNLSVENTNIKGSVPDINSGMTFSQKEPYEIEYGESLTEALDKGKHKIKVSTSFVHNEETIYLKTELDIEIN